jgi:hypothetical protein
MSRANITGITYKAIATFAGSNFYWSSHSESSFAVANAPTVAPTATIQSNLASTTDLMTYMVVGVVAIIIAIAVVGTVIVLILRKRP